MSDEVNRVLNTESCPLTAIVPLTRIAYIGLSFTFLFSFSRNGKDCKRRRGDESMMCNIYIKRSSGCGLGRCLPPSWLGSKIVG